MSQLRVGVLALQGAFARHIAMLASLGAATKEVRYPQDLDQCDGLIIPGGESTTITRQMDFIDFRKKLCHFAQEKPLFGTCAGLILMSREVMGNRIIPLGLLDVVVERNAFGRQADSFRTDVELRLGQAQHQHISALFIRAPRIRHCGLAVSVLASYQEEPILVRQGFHLGATFHPELSDSSTVHRYFLDIIREQLTR